MSSPQIRRADRIMSDERALETLARGYSGRLATVSEDGFPYCIPLLYLWMDGEVYLHTTSARGHLRANIEREPRVCFEVDEQEGVFDYGRFECDSGLAYRSVCLFGRIRIVEDRDIKQRFCEALMAKYGKPETATTQGLLPADRCHHRVCHCGRAHDRQGNGAAAAFRTVACERQDEDAKRRRALVKALAAIAVIIKQRRQMPGAYEYPMAVPARAGSLKVKIDGPRCRSPTASSGNGFWMNGTLPVVKRR